MVSTWWSPARLEARMLFVHAQDLLPGVEETGDNLQHLYTPRPLPALAPIHNVQGKKTKLCCQELLDDSSTPCTRDLR